MIKYKWGIIGLGRIAHKFSDAAAPKEEFKAFAYDLLYINDQAHIEGYQLKEEVFRNKMLS